METKSGVEGGVPDVRRMLEEEAGWDMEGRLGVDMNMTESAGHSDLDEMLVVEELAGMCACHPLRPTHGVLSHLTVNPEGCPVLLPRAY